MNKIITENHKDPKQRATISRIRELLKDTARQSFKVGGFDFEQFVIEIAEEDRITKGKIEKERLANGNIVKDKYGNIYKEVVSPYTGKIWLDRNLGASRVAQSIDDEQAYGDYFQWGRDADGHEKKSSSTIASLSSSDTPNHNQFILAKDEPYDWKENQNDNLWQGVYGKNNPCPSGFRVPTQEELQAEIDAAKIRNNKDAFHSFLKLPSAGGRYSDSGSLDFQGSYGNIWSSSPPGSNSKNLYFNSSDADWDGSNRAYGQSVRCLRD